ncbi:arrestin [Phlyctema vagabunda]|uniref:Arrestin n=1 Tax=Phlyctema vagabunda TaxID=108571 RepID=A0ABR4PKN0_9HELO
MPANVSQPASSSPVAKSGRSLFSRLTNPLKSRTRNLNDFHIRPLEPHRQYRPGDLVKGAVVLTVIKPIRITHLTVALRGFVRVYKHPNGINEPIPAEASLAEARNTTKSQYFGNGYASLFQDEVTLCGEGRLDAGVYEFNFELEFPSRGIPTSIDFERGTISYMITSTITRPTSIAATTSCDRKIALVENVDIGLLGPPRPRTISLEPIARRPRRRKTARNSDGTAQETVTAETGSGSDATRATASPRPDDSASQAGSLDHTSPQSPVASDDHSEISGVSEQSNVSSSTGMSFRLGPVPASARSIRDSQGTGSKVSINDKTITATIELLKSGCLPGETFPLKITVKHTKAIKSMHGVIITLYRQGRIDSAPPLSLFVDIKGKAAERLKHEEYYPKSKTGLGGLSLTSAGSSSVFRKDLSQTFAPIIVDPSSLTAVVNASVRVPEDVFPTILGVPGEMISFKYQVEVVVDLGGKLAGQQRHLPRVGTVTLPSSYGAPVNAREEAGVNQNLLATWGGSIVDTDHIRREKSVVACLFEVTVGTVDSARRRARGNSTLTQPRNDWPTEAPLSPGTSQGPNYARPTANDQDQSQNLGVEQQPYSYYDAPYDPSYDDQYHGYYHNGAYDYDNGYDSYDHQYPPPAHSQIHVPPPEFQAEEGLSEKERARRAEQRLLPSQPPPEDIAGPSSARTVLAASAPPAIDEHEEDIYSADGETSRTPRQPLAGAPFSPSTGPSAPDLEDLTAESRSGSTYPHEDKQELERRRLLAEASAPEFPEDDGGEGSSAPPPHHHIPSAPILTEEDEYGGHYSRHPPLAGRSQPPPSQQHEHESLPRYER